MPQICCITERRFDLYQVTSVCSPKMDAILDGRSTDGGWRVGCHVSSVVSAGVSRGAVGHPA